MPLRRVLAIALPVSASVALGWWVARTPATPMSIAPAVTIATASPSATPRIAAAIAPVSSPTQAVQVAAKAASAPASLAARVDAWMRSDDPHDAMQAYRAVFQCLLARRRAHAADLEPDPPGKDAAAACGDLRSDQIQQRVVALEKAARAGEQDAAANFIQEGPSGNGVLSDLGTTDPTPPTPEWLARRDDYIARALAHCDTGLVAYLGTTLRNQALRQEAMQHWLDRMSCPGHPAPDNTPLAEDAQAQAFLDGLAINGWRR